VKKDITYEGKIHVCRDPEDDKFVELSAKTSAPLITLDNDILDLRSKEKLLRVDTKQIKMLLTYCPSYNVLR